MLVAARVAALGAASLVIDGPSADPESELAGMGFTSWL